MFENQSELGDNGDLISCPKDNNTDAVYAQHYAVLNGVILSIIILMGIIGNIATIYVLSLHQLRAKINDYFICLAMWDTILIISSLFLYPWAAWFYGTLPSTGPHVYHYIVLYPVSNIARVACVWTLLALATERYLAIIWPLQHQINFTVTRMRIILAGVSTAAILYNLLKFFEIDVMMCIDYLAEDGSVINETKPMIIQTSLRQNPVYFVTYHIVFSAIFLYLGPFLTQIFLAGRISWQLKHSFHRLNTRRRSQTRESLETTVSRMFLVVELKFLLCFILPVSLNVCEVIYGPEILFHSFLFSYMVDWSNSMVIINSSVNFIIYFHFCPRFRSTLIDKMTCSQKQPDFRSCQNSRVGEHSELLMERSKYESVTTPETAIMRSLSVSPKLKYSAISAKNATAEV